MADQRSPHEDSIMFFIVLFLILGISWVIWTTFHLQLTDALRWVRIVEMKIVSLFVGQDYGVSYSGLRGKQELDVWQEWLPKVDVREITTSHIRVSTELTMPILKYVFAAILFIMGFWVIFKGPETIYRRKMGLQQLITEQAKMFPIIAPFVKFNPAKMRFRAPGDPVPVRLPLFSEALAPEEWVAFNQISYVNRKLDVNKSYQALARQLGQRWKGPFGLPIHGQAIYAVFALKHVRKKTEAEAMLDELAESWSPKGGLRIKPKLRSTIRKVIKDPKIGGKLTPFVNKHAYNTTALLRALMRARQEGGVLAPATFVWLRGHDRDMWYPMNNLGRKAYHAEASGALAHFTNELIAGQRIPAPKFDDVIKNIEVALVGPGARKIPSLDKSVK